MPYDIHKAEKPLTCLGCGAKLDGAMHIGDEIHKPEPGDVSICMHCRALTIYEAEGFRYPTDKELTKILSQENIQKAIRALELFHQQVGPIPGRASEGE